jgi:hypothetical protein
MAFRTEYFLQGTKVAETAHEGRTEARGAPWPKTAPTSFGSSISLRAKAEALPDIVELNDVLRAADTWERMADWEEKNPPAPS